MTAKKTTPKPTKAAAAKPAKTPQERREALEERRAREAQAREAAVAADLDQLEASITQREWLLICRRLEVTRQQIAADLSLRLLALAWVRQQRTHGGAEWDKLLGLTDEQIIGVLGYDLDGNPLTPAGDQADDQD